jgi:hypothetical protein
VRTTNPNQSDRYRVRPITKVQSLRDMKREMSEAQSFILKMCLGRKCQKPKCACQKKKKPFL